jgi:hypothetical protein
MGRTRRANAARREPIEIPKTKEAFLFEGGDGEGSCRVLPSSLVEVAELIDCPVEDLTFLRYGEAGQVVMSRSRQLDRTLVPNRNASIVIAKIHQLPVYPRGAVVCFPHGFTWDTESAQPDA